MRCWLLAAGCYWHWLLLALAANSKTPPNFVPKAQHMNPKKKSGREGQPKEPHVLRGDSGKDPPPVKQKPRSQGIEVRDRWEGDPRESPGKGSWLLLFVVVSCSLSLATGYAAGYWPLAATGAGCYSYWLCAPFACSCLTCRLTP